MITLSSTTHAMPAGLHSELSEYSRLLRALRASDTLDISTNLTRPHTDHNWTRWPLLLTDLHSPEWALQDEILLILDQSFPSAHVDVQHDLHPHVLKNITTSTEFHLSQILHLIAAHVPLAAKSMQDRLGVIAWESVLEIVSISGIIDEGFVVSSYFMYIFNIRCNRTIRKVQQRMQAIYGPSQTLG
jgi:hypothetical protein